jgi:outer membrane protein assembly factor BamA
VEADLARSFGGDTWVNFLKVGGSVTGYLPVGQRSSFALSIGGGKVHPLDGRSTTIAPKRYYLGGAGTVRGFSEDGMVPEDHRAALREEIEDCRSLVYPVGCTSAARFLQAGRSVPSDGGDLYALARAEFRFPLRGELMGGLFAEAGNLWSDPRAFEPLALRPTAGFGLRYATPVGPVALDLGTNLDPDTVLNEGRFALHFSIGLF